MIIYKCERDNIEIETSTCPVCGERAVVKASDIYWCHDCNIPLYEPVCSLCGGKAKRLTTDIRPVFPQERLLVEIVLNCPFAYQEASVWNGAGNKYYVNGKRLPFKISELNQLNAEQIRKEYQEKLHENDETYFWAMLERFVKANSKRMDYITSEALDYIQESTKGAALGDMFVSFSGGKDSTVVSSLVTRALGNAKVLHIFGDTTLEFPFTMQYVERYKKEHPATPMLSSRNKDKDFEELCRIIGPPSRVMRWCCTIFKTGAIQRKITTLFRDKKRIITFYGIRRSESVSRSKYERESDSPKITKQVTISPIIDWLDFDVWLYILTTGIDFNEAYRLGYARVGCWCCPNNTGWSEFLSRVHMSEQSQRFRKLLIEFAQSIGKKDAENYIDQGYWKARQGGNGVAYAGKTMLSYQPCVLEENAFNYELTRPIDETFYNLFTPFGYLKYDMGNKRLGEVFVLNRNQEVLLKLQGKVGSNQVKITILNPHLAGSISMKNAEEKIRCQLTKFQMCMGCLACESVCRHNALKIKETKNGEVQYWIDDAKCLRCGECINHFDGGCYMRKVLAVKRGENK